jgi:hypothetical protein
MRTVPSSQSYEGTWYFLPGRLQVSSFVHGLMLFFLTYRLLVKILQRRD